MSQPPLMSQSDLKYWQSPIYSPSIMEAQYIYAQHAQQLQALQCQRNQDIERRRTVFASTGYENMPPVSQAAIDSDGRNTYRSKVYDSHSVLASFYQDHVSSAVLESRFPQTRSLGHRNSPCIPNGSAIRALSHPSFSSTKIPKVSNYLQHSPEKRIDTSSLVADDATEDSEERTSGGDLSSRSSGSDSTPRHRSKRWNDEEQRVFIEAIRKHGRDWKRIKKCLPTRSLTQVRTHAYWYLSKLERQEHRKRSISILCSEMDSIEIKKDLAELRETTTLKYSKDESTVDESIVDIARFITTLRSKPVEPAPCHPEEATAKERDIESAKKSRVVGPPKLHHILKATNITNL